MNAKVISPAKTLAPVIYGFKESILLAAGIIGAIAAVVSSFANHTSPSSQQLDRGSDHSRDGTR